MKKSQFHFSFSTDLSNESDIVVAYAGRTKDNKWVDISGNGNDLPVSGIDQTVDGLRFQKESISFGDKGTIKTVVLRIRVFGDGPIFETLSGKNVSVSSNFIQGVFDDVWINGVQKSKIEFGVWSNVVLTSDDGIDCSSFNLGVNGSSYGNFELSEIRLYSDKKSDSWITGLHSDFANRTVLIDDFEGNTVGDVPNDWVVTSGAFEIGEDDNGKYLSCTSDGVIEFRGVDLSKYPNYGLVEKIDGLSDANKYLKHIDRFSFEGGIVKLSMTAGEKIYNLYLNEDVEVEANKKLFQAGSFDFTTNQWKDTSGNDNHADLVEGNCVNFINDVTISLDTKRVGETVTKVNGGTSTAGVTVDANGDIAIAMASLVSTKIWSIELSNGEEFRFTAGDMKFVYAKSNIGVIGGTENTDWEWSTTDDAHLNLQHGFNRYLYHEETTSCLVQAMSVSPDRPFYVKWEGVILNPNYNAYVTQKTGIFALDITNRITWGFSVAFQFYLAGTSYVYIGNNDGNWIGGQAEINGYDYLNKYLVIELSYDGKNPTDYNSFKFKINGKVISLSATSLSLYGSGTTYFGVNRGFDKNLLLRYYYIDNGIYSQKYVISGYINNLLTTDHKLEFLRLPSFSGTDTFGIAVSNPNSDNEHNEAETKIKMPSSAELIAADHNNFLYDSGGNANSLSFNDFIYNIGNRIWVDDSKKGKIKKLTILSTNQDLTNEVNGIVKFTPNLFMRIDNLSNKQVDGIDSYDGDNFLDIIKTTGIYTTAGQVQDSVKYKPDNLDYYLNNGKVKQHFHDYDTAFWLYRNYEEGKAAYDAASATDRITYNLNENMGTLGGQYFTKGLINNLHNDYGIDYPASGPPNDSDNNGDWWEWVLSAFKTIWSSEEESIVGISNIGCSNCTANGYAGSVVSSNFIQLAKSLGYNYAANFTYGGSSPMLTQENDEEILSNLPTESIFEHAKNNTITTEDGYDVEKLDGSSSLAWGIFKYNDVKANIVRIEFKFKVLSTTGNVPFSKLYPWAKNAITFDSNQFTTSDGISHNHGLSSGVWYKMVVEMNFKYRKIWFYDDSDNIVSVSHDFYRGADVGKFRIEIDGQVVVFKDIKFYKYSGFVLLSGSNIQLQNYTVDGTPYEDYYRSIMLSGINGSVTNGGGIKIFSHTYAHDPNKWGLTYNGILWRTKDTALKAISDLRAHGIKMIPVLEYSNWLSNYGNERISYIKNNFLLKNYLGFSQDKAIGWNNASIVDNEKPHSLNGEIAELNSGSFSICFRNAGIKRVRIRFKGEIKLYYYSKYNSQSINNNYAVYSNSDYKINTFYIYGEKGERIDIYIVNTGTYTSYIDLLTVDDYD